MYNFRQSTLVEDSYVLQKEETKQGSHSHKAMQMVYNKEIQGLQKVTDSMVRLPSKNKCEIELILEYRFDGTTFHAMTYIYENDILVLGTSKGHILSYQLKVDLISSETTSKDSRSTTKPSLVLEKDVG